MSSKAKSPKLETITSMEDFFNKYLPRDVEKRPITMRVNKEEHDLIIALRGVYSKRLNKAARP